MRSILFDELDPQDYAAIENYLRKEAEASAIDGLYWIKLPAELWNETQKERAAEGEEISFRFAAELAGDWLRFELLLRPEGLRDVGGLPADERQTLFIWRWADEMARKLNLSSCWGDFSQRF